MAAGCTLPSARVKYPAYIPSAGSAMSSAIGEVGGRKAQLGAAAAVPAHHGAPDLVGAAQQLGRPDDVPLPPPAS